MIPFSAKEIAVLVGAALLAAGGWTARGWYEDSKDLAAAQAIEKSREVMRDLAREISSNTETAIQGIKVENKTIYNEATKEIVEKPIYKECVVPSDGVMKINKARGAN